MKRPEKTPRQQALEDKAWRLAGDALLDDPREGDDWMMAREELATRILQRLEAEEG